jgi:hypothetical protein
MLAVSVVIHPTPRRAPYVELNEYFTYLFDLRDAADEGQRKYCITQLRKFRGPWRRFIGKHYQPA